MSCNVFMDKTSLDYTAAEYLRRQESIRFSHARADMARSCISYLSNPLLPISSVLYSMEETARFFSIHNSEDDISNSSHPVTTIFRQNQFLHYSLQNWAPYAAHREAELQDEIITFLSDSDRVGFATLIEYDIAGGNALHIAAYFHLNSIAASPKLDLNEAAYDAPSPLSNMTPLAVALSTENTELAYILAQRPDVDLGMSKTFDGPNAWKILLTNDRRAMSILLRRWCNSKRESYVDGRTLLSYAAELGYHWLAGSILAHSADEMAKRERLIDFTPMWYACSRGRRSIVEMFLELLPQGHLVHLTNNVFYDQDIISGFLKNREESQDYGTCFDLLPAPITTLKGFYYLGLPFLRDRLDCMWICLK
jgi:hypothetical protein